MFQILTEGVDLIGTWQGALTNSRAVLCFLIILRKRKS